MLQEFNLQREIETAFSKEILYRAARYLNDHGPKTRDLFWCGGCWVAMTLEVEDEKAVPRRVGGSPVWFKAVAEDTDTDPDLDTDTDPAVLGTRKASTQQSTAESPTGESISGIGLGPQRGREEIDVRTYDLVRVVDSSSDGDCEGVVLGVGLRRVEGQRRDDDDEAWVLHYWVLLDSDHRGEVTMDGSYCGSVVLDQQGRIVGLVRSRKGGNGNQCLCVAASELKNFEYDVYGVRHM